MTAPVLDSARASFERDGFLVNPTPLIAPDLLERAHAAMDDVMAERYDTEPVGLARYPVEDPRALVKVDQAHTASSVLFELVTSPAIGALAAQLTGAELVQLWAVQLLHKPGGGASAGAVGWHQDQDYWHSWWDGEVFTIWLAVSDVELDRGPLCFVRGSHRAGDLRSGDFFSNDMAGLRDRLTGLVGDWDEVPAVLPAGGASAHHKLTLHGSHPNVSDRARRSFALHLRTEKSSPKPGASAYVSEEWLSDPRISPVIYRR